MIKLKASGLEESTLYQISYRLARLAKLADLLQPEEVKLAIARLPNANSYKRNLTNAYNYFATINRIEWKKPVYLQEQKLPTIPTRENIMKIINHAKKYAPIFKTLMETGLMPKELSKVESRDIDYERRILSARGYKGHASRTFKQVINQSGYIFQEIEPFSNLELS